MWFKTTRSTTVQIQVTNKQKDLKVSAKSLRSSLSLLLSFLKVSTDEISIQLVSEKAICKLHADFFDDPSPTDCITFPLDGLNPSDYHVLGEVFICPRTATCYAKEHAIDPYEELTLYLVHGVLHLIGYEDLTSPDKRKMRSQEKKCMSFLKLKNALLKG